MPDILCGPLAKKLGDSCYRINGLNNKLHLLGMQAWCSQPMGTTAGHVRLLGTSALGIPVEEHEHEISLIASIMAITELGSRFKLMVFLVVGRCLMTTLH